MGYDPADRQRIGQQARELTRHADANLDRVARALAFSRDIIAWSMMVRSMVIEARIKTVHLRWQMARGRTAGR